MKNIDKLLQEIRKSEQSIKNLQDAEAADRQRYAELDAKRGALATAALVDHDAGAQRDLDAIEAVQWKIERKLRDYKAANANESVKLHKLRLDLAEATSIENIARLKKLLAERQDHSKRLESLVTRFSGELRAALNDASAVDVEIASILLSQDKERFAHLAGTVRSVPEQLAVTFMKYSMNDLLKLRYQDSTYPAAEMKSLSAVTEKFLATVTDAIEALPNGPGRSYGRLYQAVSTITGLKGHALKPGDFVRATQDEADELVGAGVLNPVDENKHGRN